MKKWIRLAREEKTNGDTLMLYTRRLTWMWAGITTSAFIILFLMVRKPMLW